MGVKESSFRRTEPMGKESCLSSWKSAEADSAYQPVGLFILSRRLIPLVLSYNYLDECKV
jgi:hypothetical protein